jgi:uncharacterized protein
MSYFKKTLYTLVFVGFGNSFAGSYDDFFNALTNDNVAAVNQLIQRGFDVNTLNPKGQHALGLAIRDGSPRIAKALIAAPKLNPNQLNSSGESALMFAALRGDLEVVKALAAKGADINKTGWTPLHYAASKAQLPVIAWLLENHAYIDAGSPNGTTPLMMASMYGSPEAVKLLLEEGADPMIKNSLGLAALQFAERAKSEDSIKQITKAIRAKQPAGKW